MKNPTEAQLVLLRSRSDALSRSLPLLTRGADGCLTEESRARFSSLTRVILRRHRAVGASIVLNAPSGSRDVFCYGRARLKPDVPVTASTCFRVASVSKLVMTFGALSLYEEGRLNLDADISAYLGYSVRCPAAPDVPITLRMLLTHTAALRDEGNYGTRGMEADCTLRELLEDGQNYLPQAPGTAFHYSNLGAGVAGVVLERISGMPLDTLMQQRVFAPLHIRASYDPRCIHPAQDIANGYRVRSVFPARLQYDAEALAARPMQSVSPEQDYLCAAGRLITDADGLSILARLLASHGEMGVLHRASLDLMRTPQDGLGSISCAGRGLNTAFLPDVIGGRRLVGHQGVAYGMCAELFADPQDGAGVGIMINGVCLQKSPPLMRAGFDLLALAFAALGQTH